MILAEIKAGASRDDEGQEYWGHKSQQKGQAVTTNLSRLVPLPVSHPCVCPPGKQTSLTCLQEQARTVGRAAKVAVTLNGFPTPLGEEQSLPSAALSAPLCVQTALYVTKLLKLRIAVLCQAAVF